MSNYGSITTGQNQAGSQKSKPLLSGIDENDSKQFESSFQNLDLRENFDESQTHHDTKDYETTQIVAVASKYTRCLIVPFFLILAVISLVATILGLIDIIEMDYGFFEVVGLTFIGGILGAYGVYKWGTVQGEISRFSTENNEYESEIKQLTNSIDKLKSNIEGVNHKISALKQDSAALNTSLTQFDDLSKELQGIAETNEDLNKMVDSINGLYNDMHSIAIENEKSHLYEMYYDLELRDSKRGLSKQEFQRFLGRLPIDQREKFDKLGTFNDIAGRNDVIDWPEFQRLVSHYLDENDEEIIRSRTSTF